MHRAFDLENPFSYGGLFPVSLLGGLCDVFLQQKNHFLARLGSVDIHAMARKAAERWMKAQKLVSVLS
jgi:hypothetical protein